MRVTQGKVMPVESEKQLRLMLDRADKLLKKHADIRHFFQMITICQTLLILEQNLNQGWRQYGMNAESAVAVGIRLSHLISRANIAILAVNSPPVVVPANEWEPWRARLYTWLINLPEPVFWQWAAAGRSDSQPAGEVMRSLTLRQLSINLHNRN